MEQKVTDRGRRHPGVALGCGDANLRPGHWMTDVKVDLHGEVDALYPYLDESAISESQGMAAGTILDHCEGIQLPL